jgi:hypothetical protein
LILADRAQYALHRADPGFPTRTFDFTRNVFPQVRSNILGIGITFQAFAWIVVDRTAITNRILDHFFFLLALAQSSHVNRGILTFVISVLLR